MNQLDPKPTNNYDHLRLYFASLKNEDKLKVQVLLQEIYKLNGFNNEMKHRIEVLEYELHMLKNQRAEDEKRRLASEKENKQKQERLKFVR